MMHSNLLIEIFEVLDLKYAVRGRTALEAGGGYEPFPSKVLPVRQPPMRPGGRCVQEVKTQKFWGEIRLIVL